MPAKPRGAKPPVQRPAVERRRVTSSPRAGGQRLLPPVGLAPIHLRLLADERGEVALLLAKPDFELRDELPTRLQLALLGRESGPPRSQLRDFFAGARTLSCEPLVISGDPVRPGFQVGLGCREAFLTRPDDGSGPDQLALALGGRPVSVRQLALLLL